MLQSLNSQTVLSVQEPLLSQNCSLNWRGIPKKLQNDKSDAAKPESTNSIISSGAIAIARLFPQLAGDSKKASKWQVRRSKAWIHKQYYQFRSHCYRKTVPSIGEAFQKSFKMTSPTHRKTVPSIGEGFRKSFKMTFQTFQSLNPQTISVQNPLLSQDCSSNWRRIPKKLQNHKLDAPKPKSTNNISSGAIAIARVFPQLANFKKASKGQVKYSNIQVQKQ